MDRLPRLTVLPKHPQEEPMKSLFVASFALATLAGANAFAEGSPVGYWKTIDDETGNPASVVQIWKDGESVSGKIVQLFVQPGEDADPTCEECEGALKTEKVVGLTILSGLEEDGDEWSGGDILDPGNGKSYSCYIEVQDGGKKLKVRGYLGIALLGRTQYWHRVAKPDLNIRSFRLEGDKAVPIAWNQKPEDLPAKAE
jgi:uncharacterized protein (DUF2147 family)